MNDPDNNWNSLADHLNMTSFTPRPNEMNSDYSGKLSTLEKDCSRITRQLGEVKSVLEVIMQTDAQKDKAAAKLKSIVKEWKLVALCLDRLFFIIYLVSIILSLIFLFPKPLGY